MGRGPRQGGREGGKEGNDAWGEGERSGVFGELRN